jgi:cytochrome c556
VQGHGAVLRKLAARVESGAPSTPTRPGGIRMQSFLKFRPSLVVAALALVTGLPASAQFQKPEDAVKYRQSAFTVMANHFGRIGAMANGKVPFDAGAAQASADIVVMMSKLPYAAFAPGTESVGNTRAKPEVWSKSADFEAGAKKMQDEVVKLQAATKTGSLDQIKAAFGDAGKACKACHDNYRKE